MEQSTSFVAWRWNLAAALVFASVAVVGSFTPFQPRHIRLSVAVEYVQNSLQHGTYFSPVDWASNFLLFVPLAFFALGSLEHATRSLPAGAFVLTGLLAALVLFSVTLELCQIWISGRVPSPHDVGAQCLGAVCGMLAWLWCGPAIANTIWRYVTPLSRGGLRGGLSMAYLFGVVAYSFFPLDLTLHPHELWRKWKAGHIVLLPLTDAVAKTDLAISSLRQVALFLPLGLLWLVRRPGVRGLRRVAPLGLAAVPVGLEVLQVFTYSRWASATHALAGLVGVVLGRVTAEAIAKALRSR